jgi:drug/metabolite transporter (DMT)-like permease
MDKAILLALVASFCTASSSVCQRLGARKDKTQGFDLRLVWHLARHPIWLLGLASMILGFVFQLSALHFGPLALVQPVLALELLFVFAYMTVFGSPRVNVRPRDWLAAVAMSAGIGSFLRVASPSGGRQHAPGSLWWPAGLTTLALVLLALALTFGPLCRYGASPSRRAALLGAATGVSWGFVAAIIKELSSRLDEGIGAVAASWPPYVLIVVGAGTLILASHALAAGPLAASQPGFTILDPLWASLLGLLLFGERIRTSALDLILEALTLALIVVGVSVLSHSHLITGEHSPPPDGIADHRTEGHHELGPPVPPDGLAQFLDADQVARGITEGAVANSVRLLGRLLDNLGVTALHPLEGAVQVLGGQEDPAVGTFGHHLGDDAALVIGDAGVGGRRRQEDGRAGLAGRADGDPAHLAPSDIAADLEAEGVAIEGQGGVRVIVRKEARVNGDVHAGHTSCGSMTGASRFLTGLVTCFATHGGIPAIARAAWLW